MASPDASAAQQKTAAKSRPARERVLPVAQIYRVVQAEAQGGQAMATLVIGDERTSPKRHGIRATREDWMALVAALAEAHPQLGEEMALRLRGVLGARSPAEAEA